jgi:AcrR family transcriptional regulator
MSSVAEPVKDVFVQQQILAAAKKLFQTHGLQKVTMDDVAKAIGKGRSSLYYYYKSRDEIFDAVMQTEIREMLSAMTAAVEKAGTAEAKLLGFCMSKLTVLREKRSFYKVLDAGIDADAISQFNQMKLSHHAIIMKQESALLEQILRYGIEKGELQPVDDQQMPVLILVLLTSLRGVKREMEIENKFDNMDQAVTTLTQVMIHGLKK